MATYWKVNEKYSVNAQFYMLAINCNFTTLNTMWSQVCKMFSTRDSWLVNTLVHQYHSLDWTRTQHQQNTHKRNTLVEEIFSNSSTILFVHCSSSTSLNTREDFNISDILVLNNTDIKYLSPLGTVYLINIYQQIFLDILMVI